MVCNLTVGREKYAAHDVEVREILTESGRAERRARAALALGRPDAAERLADLVTALADGKKGHVA